MTKGNYERLISEHSRELLEGTVGAIARSAKEDGVEKGIRKERERIIALLEQADSACSPWAIALIKETTSVEHSRRIVG